MLKILQMRLQQYLNFSRDNKVNFQIFKLDLETAEEPEIELSTSIGSSKKQESSRKTPTSALLTMPKPLTVWITTNCGKVLKRWEYQTTWPASWEIHMQVKKQPLELDMEQQTGSKSGKEYIKAVYCHPAYLTYVQSTSWEILDLMKHKLESRLPGEISITSYVDDTTLMAESEEELKSLLVQVKEEREKADLKLSIQRLRSWHQVPSLHGKKMGKQWKQWQTLFSLAPKSLLMVTAAIKLKDACSSEKSYDQPRQHIKKQRHYFADKGLCSQSYGFSSSHVWMWELDYKES